MSNTAPDPRSHDVRRFEGSVSADDRRRILGHGAACLWFTGLSGSGKSTLAHALEARLAATGHLACVLDGDNLRHGLCSDLGFSAEARTENIRRAAEVARLFVDSGLIVITAFISPFLADRAAARTRIGPAFIEVFVDPGLATCEARDPKGLYQRARAGLLPAFTGISSPYEPPTDPDLRLDTSTEAVERSLERIEVLLRTRGVLTDRHA